MFGGNLQKFCALLPGGHPAQYFTRQIVYKYSFDSTTTTGEPTLVLPDIGHIQMAGMGRRPVQYPLVHNTIQYHTIQYNTIQYNTIQLIFSLSKYTKKLYSPNWSFLIFVPT